MIPLLPLALAVVGAAVGQSAQEAQILSPPPAPRDVSSDQVATATRDDRAAQAPQVAPERDRMPQASQLSRGRSASAAEPLSRPRDGRGVPVIPVAGRDGCDRANAGSSIRACERPIEARSAEYARPEPPRLSPEERLLSNQRARVGLSASAGTSPRPDDAQKADPTSGAGQMVAEIVRRGDADALSDPDPRAPDAVPPGVAPEALIVLDNLQTSTPPR